MDDSTEGKGSMPLRSGAAGGVRACWRGEALYDSRLYWETEGKGGREARLIEEGDWGI